tara:strand:+ start:1494 stop:2750 length:1257 start_codon:yes stop_codon:yes gene_type:complete
LNWKEVSVDRSAIFGGAVSGGLDSCTVTHWLSDKGVNVHCYTVDLGQPDEENLDAVARRMVACGAKQAHIIDGKASLARAGLKVIQAQARYEGGYWNTTGIARPVTVNSILNKFSENGVKILFHGATGRGNDQVRFQLATNMLDSEVSVYAPWRDQEFLERFPGRAEMIKYCEDKTLPIKPASESRYSTDANFLGLTHEAGDLEDLSVSPDFVTPEMGVWSWDSPDIPDYATVEWEHGVPISLNGKRMDLTDIFIECNSLAGKHGIGIGTHVIENRFVGIKSRGIYESPGIELLGQSYEFLLQFILDRRARELFNALSALISTQIYEGYWYDLATTSALAALDKISTLATGKIQMKLYKGSIFFETADDSPESMPYSLYTDDGSMEAMGGYDHKDAEGFLNVLGVSAKNVGRKQTPNQ